MVVSLLSSPKDIFLLVGSVLNPIPETFGVLFMLDELKVDMVGARLLGLYPAVNLGWLLDCGVK